MKTKQLFAPLLTVAIALVGFASAASARAGEATYEYPTAVQSALTRAEVKAEAVRARVAGEISSGEHAHVITAAGVAKSRVQVVAEAREAVRLGLVSRGERTVFPTAEQLARVELAGLKALDMTVAAR